MFRFLRSRHLRSSLENNFLFKTSSHLEFNSACTSVILGGSEDLGEEESRLD